MKKCSNVSEKVQCILEVYIGYRQVSFKCGTKKQTWLYIS